MSTSQTEPTIEPRLDTYTFYQQEWDGYEELRDAFEWEIPAQFNMATYVCDRWAEADPGRVAVHIVEPDGTDTEYTYRQLQRRANQLANYFDARGVGQGDRIAVSGAQRVECLIANLAAWKLGAVSIPLSLRFGPDGLSYRLEDSEASAFVLAAPNAEALREVKGELDTLSSILTVGAPPAGDEVAFQDAINTHPNEFETAATDPEENATIMYTSGTTGQPKGVVHPHRTLLGWLTAHVLSVRNMNLRRDDVLYSPGEWSWSGPLYQGVLSSLYYGTTVLGDADPRFDPAATFDLLDEYDVSLIGGATTVYRLMMQVPNVEERYDLSSLRVVLGAGETLGQTVVNWWRDVVDDIAVHETYGQTETSGFTGDCEALGVAHEPGHMGKLLPGVEGDVLDSESREPLGEDEIGELVVRYEGNPGCMKEYWNKPEKTTAKIQDGWLLTEDTGSRTADGYFSFHSRADDVIISSGYRIGPAEIEESLAEHEAVANAGVIGVPDETRGEIPKAFVTLGEGYEATNALKDDLKTHVKDRLAKHEYPRAMEFIEALPKTTTGKVRRHDLRKREGITD